ncbi:VanZ family protein [Salinibacterium sp.]|uniref:VanZ family protein n=1 Tax=Salinibacterium sp. TaxID=1915057 RepID=UPI00286BE7B0|nr:VanZ family protein [Salinibacterium sp.]
MDDRSPRPRTWAAAGLIVYALAACVVLLAPVSYGGMIDSIWHTIGGSTRSVFGAGWIEFAANIVLFVPLGLLLTLLFRNPWAGVIAGMVVSIGVEIAQIVIPFRQPTVRDVIANVIGAGVGASVGWLVLSRRQRRASRIARRSGAQQQDLS